MNRSAASSGSSRQAIASPPADVPGHHDIHDSGDSNVITPDDQVGVTIGHRQRDVAAIAVTDDQHGTAGLGGAVDDLDEVVDLLVDPERTGVRSRSPVTTPVVPRDPKSIIEPSAELQQSGRSIERTVHKHDVLGADDTGRRRPDQTDRRAGGHWTCTMRSTSAAVEAARSGEPASTTTVSPSSIRPSLTAVSTANQTISSVVA